MNYNDVAKEAIGALNQFNLKHEDDDDALDIVAFAESYGFKVCLDNLKEGDAGYIIVSNEMNKNYGTNKVIIINQKDCTTRQRFTIAHEMAHYLLHFKGQEVVAHRDTKSYGNNKSRLEKEADYFASVLLMPAKKVANILNRMENLKLSNYEYNSTLIDLTKRIFKVSEPAAMTRLSQLGVLR